MSHFIKRLKYHPMLFKKHIFVHEILLSYLHFYNMLYPKTTYILIFLKQNFLFTLVPYYKIQNSIYFYNKFNIIETIFPEN